MLAEYASVTVELELRRDDRALAALPLYHTAQLHCFTMPQLLNGAFTILLEAPNPALLLELIEARAHHQLLRPADTSGSPCCSIRSSAAAT